MDESFRGTIFVSFRRVDGLDFQGAYDMLSLVISELFRNHLYLLDSDRVIITRRTIKRIAEGEATVKEIKNSLALLITAMRQHYNKNRLFY